MLDPQIHSIRTCIEIKTKNNIHTGNSKYGYVTVMLPAWHMPWHEFLHFRLLTILFAVQFETPKILI